jgi:hypothetical protein
MATLTLPPGLQGAFDASKATYNRLGRSGLIVSVPILGAMSFGSKEWADWVLNEDEVCLGKSRRGGDRPLLMRA